VIGQALCPDCYDYQGAVLFNAGLSELWRRTTDADHGNSPLSIIEIPQVLARGGVMPETTRWSWTSPPS